MIAKLLTIPFGSIWNVRKKAKGRLLLSPLYKFLYDAYMYENNSSIPLHTKIKSEPCFPHGPKGIFISGDASIGYNCVIFHQVTIGSNMLSGTKRYGAPRIGDNVYIGTGAKLIGAVTVGNNVRIGANCVVYKDVPDNTVVVSSEQRNIEKTFVLDNRFFINSKGSKKYFDNGVFKDI